MRKTVRTLLCTIFSVMLLTALAVSAYASGNVAGVVQQTWVQAKAQIQSVVDNVVFPAIDVLLAIFFFVTLGTSYFEYKKRNSIEFTAPAILFVSLVFTLTAPLYIWTII